MNKPYVKCACDEYECETALEFKGKIRRDIDTGQIGYIIEDIYDCNRRPEIRECLEIEGLASKDDE
jgi:hypothetical protein